MSETRLIALVFLVAFARPATAIEIIPPGSEPFGRPYPEWISEWWEWSNSLKQDPELTGDYSVGQSGDVWFFGGLHFLGRNERHVEVPQGKALFFPVETYSFFSISEDPASEPPTDFDATLAELRAGANGLIDGMSDVQVQLNGEPVEDIERFLFRADEVPAFSLSFEPDTVYSPLFEGFGPFPPQTLNPVAAGGWFLMLAPPKLGQHRIDCSFDHASFGATDVTTFLTVVPEPSSLALALAGLVGCSMIAYRQRQQRSSA